MNEPQGTVYLVDDDPGMCKALIRLVRSQGLKAEAFKSAHEFLEHHTTDSPACLVADIRMPGLTGLDLQSELRKRNVHLPIVFITGHGDVRTSVQAMKGGAVDFLLKPFAERDVIAVIHQALEKDKRGRTARTEQNEIQRRLQTLTHREHQVYELVIRGLLNKQIAAELGATEQTIKVHRHRVMEKMGVSSVAELVRGAVNAGVIQTSGHFSPESGETSALI